MLVCVLCTVCTRDRGCSVHPVFPAPSDFLGRDVLVKLAQIVRRDREVAPADGGCCLTGEVDMCRPCGRDERKCTHAGVPAFAGTTTSGVGMRRRSKLWRLVLAKGGRGLAGQRR